MRQLVLAAAYVLVAALVLPGSLAAQEEPAPPPGSVTEVQTAPEDVPVPDVAAAPEPSPDAVPAPTGPTPEPRRAASPPPAPASPAKEPVAVASGAGSVTMVDFAFKPASVSVNAGDTVTWTNSGDEGHSATGDGFDTGILSKGESGSHTFSEAGTFSYICTPHPFMKGTVRVASTGGGGSQESPGAQPGSSTGSGSAPGAGTAGEATSPGGPQLPNSGGDAWALALLGGGLLGLGLLMRRRAGVVRSGE